MEETVEQLPLVSQTTVETNEEVSIDEKHDQIPSGNFLKSKEYLSHFFLWPGLFVCLLLVAGPLALYISHSAPTVRTRNAARDLFSEERAQDYLNNLTKFGSRVGNTRGNFQAREYLIAQIQRIRSTGGRHLRFQMDVQNFTNGRGEQLQNILVRVSNAKQTSGKRPSLLLSAHYDSVEFSPGSCDDGSGVVVLLELFSNLIHDFTLTFSMMDLTLLFTDGEESGLQGAHAFRANHTWWSDARYLINVDSASCHEVTGLVESTRSQLVMDYSRVPRPRASVIFECLSKWFPFRSDYTVFTADSTRLAYNFGFLLDAYTYHTSLDRPSRVKRGILQDLGDNLGHLIRNILSRPIPTLANVLDADPLIYFDVLGRYLMRYRLSTSISIQKILTIAVVLTGISLIITDHVWHRLRASPCHDHQCIYFNFRCSFLLRCALIILYVISDCVSVVVGQIGSSGFAWILSKWRPFAWYGNPTLAMFLFACPYLIGFVLSECLFDLSHRYLLRKSSKVSNKHWNAFHGNFERHFAILLVYCLLMTIAIHVQHRLFYLILVWSIFICPIYLLLLIAQFILHWKQTSRQFFEQRSPWLYVPLIISLLPLTHTIATINSVLRLLIPWFIDLYPIGFLVASHLIICSVVTVPTIFLALNLISVIQRRRHFGRALLALLLTFTIVLLCAVAHQPFNENRPKMFYAKHASQTNFKLESLTNTPSIAPLVSQSASITVTAYDDGVLSHTLDHFSAISGHQLQNKQCRISNNCTVDDTFNRKLAVERIRVERTKNLLNYIIRIEHVSSYHIRVSFTSAANFTVRNAFHIPRTETIVDVVFNSTAFPVRMNIDIQRCDIDDSPFLLLFTRLMPNYALRGVGNCRAIDDRATLIISSSEWFSQHHRKRK